MGKIFVTLSMEENFGQKFLNFLHNLQSINADISPEITIEKVYKEPWFAAVPVESNNG